MGSATGGKRLTVHPSRPTRNLVKFHSISLSFSTLVLSFYIFISQAIFLKSAQKKAI